MDAMVSARFNEFIRTDLPEPGDAKIREIHRACLEEYGSNGINFPSGERNNTEPSAHGEDGRVNGNNSSTSEKGAAALVPILPVVNAGTVEANPATGSPVTSHTSQVPQEATKRAKSLERFTNFSRSPMGAQVAKQARN